MNVLHLIDAASPQACPTTLALLADTLRADASLPMEATDATAEVWLLGGTAMGHAAAAADLTAARRIGVPFGHALLGLAGVRHHLRRRGPDAPPIERVQAWSIGALALARVLMPRVPRVLMLTQMPAPGAMRLLHRLIKRPGPTTAHVRALGDTLAHALLAAGIDADLVHPLPLSMDLSRLTSRTTEREALRRRWGTTDERAGVVALLSDPATAGDARAAAITLSLTDQSLRRDPQPPVLTLLVHPGQRHGLRTRQMLRELHSPIRLVQEPRLASPWQVLAGVDVALAMGSCAGGLSLAWARAAQCPIVAAPQSAVREQISHERTGLIAVADHPQGLAHQITRLLREPGLVEELVRSDFASPVGRLRQTFPSQIAPT